MCLTSAPTNASRLSIICNQAKRPRLSILQSQTLSAASYVTGIADIMGESDVDLGEVRRPFVVGCVHIRAATQRIHPA